MIEAAQNSSGIDFQKYICFKVQGLYFRLWLYLLLIMINKLISKKLKCLI